MVHRQKVDMYSHIFTRSFDKAIGFDFANGYGVLIAPIEYHKSKSKTRIQINYAVPITITKNGKILGSLPFNWWNPGDDEFAIVTPEEVVEALNWASTQEADK